MLPIEWLANRLVQLCKWEMFRDSDSSPYRCAFQANFQLIDLNGRAHLIERRSFPNALNYDRFKNTKNKCDSSSFDIRLINEARAASLKEKITSKCHFQTRPFDNRLIESDGWVWWRTDFVRPNNDYDHQILFQIEIIYSIIYFSSEVLEEVIKNNNKCTEILCRGYLSFFPLSPSPFHFL